MFQSNVSNWCIFIPHFKHFIPFFKLDIFGVALQSYVPLMLHTIIKTPHSIILIASFAPCDGTHFSLFLSSYREQY